MRRHSTRHTRKAGLPPGTVVYTGDKTFENVRASLVRFSAEDFSEEAIGDFGHVPPVGDGHTGWITVNGVHQPDKIEALCSHFGIHHLAVEDICNTSQRPKVVDYDDHYFVVINDFRLSGEDGQLHAEQVGIIIKPNLVITFAEGEADLFRPLKERMRARKSKVLFHGADYLAYIILDYIVDNYFIVLETIGDKIEALESELISNPTKATLHAIYHYKKDTMLLNKSLWPLRKMLAQITQDSLFVAEEGVLHYFKDLYDHVMQIIEVIEGYGEIIVGMFEIYASGMSIKMNNIMKILTTIATIFIPLTFLAGVYGMNFRYMPGLTWKYGYYAIVVIMLGVAISMLIYFRKKKWL
jgi:magnesium transporter